MFTCTTTEREPFGGVSPDLVEAGLRDALSQATASPCPAILADALRYAVFPGGARIRPQLCLAVSHTCGNKFPELSLTSATAIELFHCASLVQDDLPCFDNGGIRRGRPALHRVFGEQYAVLAADGLIIVASELLASVETGQLDRRTKIQRCVHRAVGPRQGLVAGQAWESEPSTDLLHYHACKTAGLFEAATICGALASGGDERAWSVVGRRFGEAYQVADDIADLSGNCDQMGKPVLQDRIKRRPNMALKIGVGESIQELRRLFCEAEKAVPECTGRIAIRASLRALSTSILRTATRGAASTREEKEFISFV